MSESINEAQDVAPASMMNEVDVILNYYWIYIPTPVNSFPQDYFY